MSKYIDAEKLKKLIDEKYRECKLKGFKEDSTWHHYADGLDLAEQLVDSLQQEQGFLPDNLDEAAEEYAYNNWEDNDYHTGASEGLPFDAIGHTEKCFKAGAEWQKAQDESRKRANIKLANTDIPIDADMEIAFNDIWLDAEVSIERDGNLDEELTDAMKALCHDFFESGKEWALKAKEESK